MVRFREEAARRVYEAAVDSVLAKVVADFKARAAAVTTPEEMCAVGNHLRQERRELEERLDYRYSVLPLTFARLIREGHLDEARLNELSQEKAEFIRDLLARLRS